MFKQWVKKLLISKTVKAWQKAKNSCLHVNITIYSNWEIEIKTSIFFKGKLQLVLLLNYFKQKIISLNSALILIVVPI